MDLSELKDNENTSLTFEIVQKTSSVPLTLGGFVKTTHVLGTQRQYWSASLRPIYDYCLLFYILLATYSSMCMMKEILLSIEN